METVRRVRSWLFPVALILFILEMLLFPLVLHATYATGSRSPEHILTYTTGSLRWDSSTRTDENGAAQLSLFETMYDNVNADNAEKVLAPGTASDSVLRLKNDASNPVTYTAVLYAVRSDERLPVSVHLSGDDLTDTARYSLPDGVAPSAVIRAVSGELAGGRMQDLAIDWAWTFEDEDEREARDLLDTYLGDAAADGHATDFTVGVYVVVEDGGKAVQPPVQTGETSLAGAYLVLLAISGVLLLLLALGRRKKSDEKNH